MKRAVLLHLAGLFALLGGCGLLQPKPADPVRQALWEQRRAALGELAEWQAKGSASFVSDITGWSATYRWKQAGDRYDILLIAPLGQGRFMIQGDSAYVTVRDSKGGQFSGADPAAMLLESLKVEVPVLAMRYWLLGLPRPGSDYRVELDEQGRPQQLEQDAWRIDYSDYDADLPGKVLMLREPYRIKLSVRDWQSPRG